jgi:hypothetical protein
MIVHVKIMQDEDKTDHAGCSRITDGGYRHPSLASLSIDGGESGDYTAGCEVVGMQKTCAKQVFCNF